MPEMTKKVTYIVTYTGKVFEFMNPKPEMVCIEDIAHALANICRYTGHIKQFYSVAQHCVLMANADLPGDPLVRLLHDAAEVYIGDLASPWKSLLYIENPEYPEKTCQPLFPVKKFESSIQRVVGLALNVDLNSSVEIKESDTRMFWTEVRDLMPKMPKSFNWGPPKMEPVEEVINPWPPFTAEMYFLELYNELKG